MNVTLNSLTSLQVEWQGVVRMRERMHELVISTFAFDPITSPVFGNILYNLPLVLAFDVLKQALLQAKEDGQFTSSESALGNLMDDAKASLSWIDWQALREEIGRRNKLVQEGRLFGDKECLQDIADIEAQLLAWGVITAVASSEVQ